MKLIKFLVILFFFFFSTFAVEGIDRSKIDSLKNALNHDEAFKDNNGAVFDEGNYIAQMDSSVVFKNGKAVDTVVSDATKPEADFDDGILYNQYIDFGERDKFYTTIAVDTLPLRRFGEVFIKSLKNKFPKFGPVSPSYRIGLGDEIHISVWGEVQTHEQLQVDRLGKITPKGIGAVQVAGKTMEEVKKNLVTRYSKIYSGVT